MSKEPEITKASVLRAVMACWTGAGAIFNRIESLQGVRLEPSHKVLVMEVVERLTEDGLVHTKIDDGTLAIYQKIAHAMRLLHEMA